MRIRTLVFDYTQYASGHPNRPCGCLGNGGTKTELNSATDWRANVVFLEGIRSQRPLTPVPLPPTTAWCPGRGEHPLDSRLANLPIVVDRPLQALFKVDLRLVIEKPAGKRDIRLAFADVAQAGRGKLGLHFHP